MADILSCLLIPLMQTLKHNLKSSRQTCQFNRWSESFARLIWVSVHRANKSVRDPDWTWTKSLLKTPLLEFNGGKITKLSGAKEHRGKRERSDQTTKVEPFLLFEQITEDTHAQLLVCGVLINHYHTGTMSWHRTTGSKPGYITGRGAGLIWTMQENAEGTQTVGET